MNIVLFYWKEAEGEIVAKSGGGICGINVQSISSQKFLADTYILIYCKSIDFIHSVNKWKIFRIYIEIDR